MKSAESMHALLKEIRSLQVVVIHPVDQDGEELVGQLRRIGCRHESHWPELDALPAGTDLVLLAVRPETLSIRYPWLGKPSTPPVIPVVAFENPITLAAVLQLDAFTTIASPVRSAGLLTALALTLHQSKQRRSRERYIGRLEQKSAHQRVIQQATAILMDHRGLPESDAYQFLRSKAMLMRESIEVVARDIVRARDTLSS